MNINNPDSLSGYPTPVTYDRFDEIVDMMTPDELEQLPDLASEAAIRLNSMAPEQRTPETLAEVENLRGAALRLATRRNVTIA